MRIFIAFVIGFLAMQVLFCRAYFSVGGDTTFSGVRWSLMFGMDMLAGFTAICLVLF